MNKLLLLSCDNKLKKNFKEFYKESSFYIVEIFEEINKIDLGDYDGIIIDYFMSRNDGYNILCNIKNDIRIFIIFPDLKIQSFPFLKDLNISYIFYKPICMPFFDRILNITFSNDVSYIDVFRSEIVKIFIELGLSFKLNGTKYLFFLITLILCDIIEINSDIYALVSEEYHVSEECVKKDISYAITTCFNKRENEEIKRRIFNSFYSDKTGAVTNLDFIYNVSIYIMCNIKEKELIYN